MRVQETYVRQSTELIHVWVADEELQVTPNHLFYVHGQGWVPASELIVGDHLSAPEGSTFPVTKVRVESFKEPITVYNFEVDNYHSYHVGTIGILVHNANYTPKRPSKGVIRTENHPDGSITYTKIINGEEISVTYNKEGFPDFTPFTHPDYPKPVLIKYSGDRRTDYRLANEKVGRPEAGATPPEHYIWHHMEDGKSMILVQEAVHSTKLGGFPHTGGFSVNKNK
jgi:hypothetical protein